VNYKHKQYLTKYELKLNANPLNANPLNANPLLSSITAENPPLLSKKFSPRAEA
jgi:hypothetical protein